MTKSEFVLSLGVTNPERMSRWLGLTIAFDGKPFRLMRGRKVTFGESSRLCKPRGQMR